MALFTSHTHFTYEPCYIPNAAPSTGNSEADRVAQMISQYEPMYLRYILGYPLYESLVNGVGDGDIYDDIKNGVEFVDSYSLSQKWDGFVAGNNPIALYTYYHYMRANASTTFGIGESVAEIENARRVSPYFKMKTAWNEMVNLNWMLHEFLYANKDVYPDYIGLKYPPLNRIPLNYPDQLRKQQAMFVKMSIL